MDKYRYGFSGKENDNDNEVKGEGNQQDYGMRIYDPRVGRFLSVDRLTKQYAFYTPYQFAGNTPLQAVDLDGGEPEFVFAASKIRDYENNLRKNDPAHTEDIILEHKKTAFLTVGSMLTAGSGPLFTAFADAVTLYGTFQFGKGIVKKDAKSVQEGTELMAGAAIADMGGALIGKVFKSITSKILINELKTNGVRFNSEDILDIGKNQSGKVVFLEKGNPEAGLQHILLEHRQDFIDKGIAEKDISKIVFEAATNGKQVGISGKSRPVYEVMYKGVKKTIAVDVGSNGFIVGANPATKYKPLK